MDSRYRTHHLYLLLLLFLALLLIILCNATGLQDDNREMGKLANTFFLIVAVISAFVNLVDTLSLLFDKLGTAWLLVEAYIGAAIWFAIAGWGTWLAVQEAADRECKRYPEFGSIGREEYSFYRSCVWMKLNSVASFVVGLMYVVLGVAAYRVRKRERAAAVGLS